ncbi:hydrolase/acyltransferase [Paenibacillus sp. J5C_2022]|uniref:hydrolase/acyltransferase n=1 Tax=Paenibacillus sp. J5C2022 TaxID=2977129 RepID=UPI0021D0F02B|nr:hydrolase/acyltransferase [Paenibacillus sp. J5C2022]MCU6709217.1 hydrolase/acyltransferase [Paenibacillus sp. J5C2022]
MATMRYVIMKQQDEISFVEMPQSHAYQLSALNLRLHKEIDKLTAEGVPALPYAIAECDNVDLHDRSVNIHHGLTYMNELEQSFASIQEKSYPLISLLTEIRALQAQLEQWYEELEEEEQAGL